MKQELIDLQKAIDKGREGKSIWIPLHFPKMGQEVGIGKSIYTIVGGMSGTGKTAFTDLAYVLAPYKWMKQNYDKTGITIRVIYHSMERSKTYKLAKWVSMKLYTQYNILMDVPDILGWGVQRNRVPEEVYQKIVKCFDYFNEMLDYVEIIEGPINPTGIWKNAYNYAETVGKFEKVPYTTLEGDEKYHTIYKTNDENLVTVVLLDHIGKLKGELNDGVFLQPQSKALMDKMSDYAGSELRDRLGFSPVIVSQFNRGLEDTQRRVKTEMSPLPSDFKNTGNLYEDADVALALYNPYKLGDNENLGYNIPAFVNSKGYNRFRSCYVLKNSYGVDDIAFGYNFIGEVGIMYELKKAGLLTPEDYLRFTEIKATTI